MACSPVLAQADSVGPQYETEIPGPTGEGKVPQHHNSINSPQAESSNLPGGGAGGSGGSGGNGSSNQSSPSPGGNPSTGTGGGTEQGKQGNAGGPGTGGLGEEQPVGSSAAPEGSSSPLVPILIAIAVLAAISVAAVVIRQRRQRRAPGAQISPKAS
jgi:hypothetical protein